MAIGEALPAKAEVAPPVGLLGKIHKGKQKMPRRTMIYGPHGIGKSTFGAMADAPIFVPTEDGIGEIDCESFPLAKSFAEVMNPLMCLLNENHSYKTVVVDSLDWLERLIWAEICKERNVDNISDIGYGKGYDAAVGLWKEFLGLLMDLRDKRGMGCVLVAHAEIKKFEDPDADSNYDRYTPKLHKAASAIVQEWCDEVLFATWRVFTKSQDEGFGKKSTKALTSGERILRTTTRPSHDAKNRLSLPDELPLDYREYAKHF